MMNQFVDCNRNTTRVKRQPLIFMHMQLHKILLHTQNQDTKHAVFTDNRITQIISLTYLASFLSTLQSPP